MSKELQALTTTLSQYILKSDMRDNKIRELEATIEAIGDVTTVTELTERIEELEDEVSDLTDDKEELQKELEEAKLPKSMQYLDKDYLECMQDAHFLDELEQLIRKYKGF